jgi:hypothetical protein
MMNYIIAAYGGYAAFVVFAVIWMTVNFMEGLD